MTGSAPLPSGTAAQLHSRVARAFIACAAVLPLLPGAAAGAPVYPAQPAAAAGLMCASGMEVSCFTSSSMRKRWTVLQDSHTFAPVITPGIVVVGSTSGVHALDASNGATLWHWGGDGQVFSPAVDAGIAYAADRRGGITAIDLDEGAEIWRRRLEGWLYTPALVGDLVVTGGQAGVVYALERRTGRLAWRRSVDQELVFRPVAAGDGVIVTTFAGSVYKLGPGGEVVWRKQDSSPSFSPAVAGGLVVFGGMDGRLRARSVDDGMLRWTVQLSGQLSIPAGVHGGELAIATPDAELALIDASSGAVRARMRLPGRPAGKPVHVMNAWHVLYRASGILRWLYASMNEVSSDTRRLPGGPSTTKPIDSGGFMNPKIPAAAALSFALVAGGLLAAPPFGQEEDVSYSQDLWKALESANLAGDGAIQATPYEGQHPHGAVLQTLDGELTVNDHTGEVIVKRNYGGEGVSVSKVANDPGQFLGSVTVMFRREQGYDPDNGNWFWAKYKPDGSLHTNPKDMKLAGRVAKGADKGCIACHGGAPGGDMVFNNDRF